MKFRMLPLIFFILMSLFCEAQINPFQKYYIDCQQSGLQIRVDQSTSELIQDKFLTAADRDTSFFQFSLLPVDNGYFAVHLRHPNHGNLYWKALDNRRVSLSNHYSETAHHWKLVYEPSKKAYYIESRKYEGEVLDVFGASRNAGAKVTLYGKTGTPNQFFTIRRFENPKENYQLEVNKNGCHEVLKTSLGGGKITYSEDPTADIYDKSRLSDTSSWFYYVQDTLGQKGQWISDYIKLDRLSSCSGSYSVYLDGQDYSNFISINMDQLVERLMTKHYPNRAAQGNYKPLKVGMAHLITIKSPAGRMYYIPIAIGNVPFITEVLGEFDTPETPKFILRDPPGDKSYATIQQDEEVCYEEVSSLQTDQGEELEISARVGVKGSMGLIVETEYEAYAQVSGGLTIGQRVNEDQSIETCLKATDTYSTSDDDGIIGDEGDVYVGISQKMAYGIQGRVGYNYSNGDFYYENPVFVSIPVKTNSTFMWTESYLLEEIGRHFRNAADTTKTEEERNLSRDQFGALAGFFFLNARIKNEAELIKSVNFSAGAGATFDEEVAISESATVQTTAYIDKSLATEIGASVGGSGGSVSARVYINKEVGKSETSTKAVINSISYTFDDDDANAVAAGSDKFSVLIKEDPIFGTPVFELDESVSRTSCPYEGGYALDQPDLSIKVEGESFYRDSAVARNVPATDNALFRLRIENKSDRTRTYVLKSDPNKITESTRITLNGKTLHSSGDQTLYTDLRPGEVIEPLIEVFKGDQRTTNYHGPIPLILSSECGGDHDQESVAYLEVYFEDATSTLNHQKEELGFDIYPNPSRGTTHFDFHQSGVQGTMEIINLQGQVLMQKSIFPNQSRFNEDLSFLPNGVYQVRVRDENGQFMRKLIKN